MVCSEIQSALSFHTVESVIPHSRECVCVGNKAFKFGKASQLYVFNCLLKKKRKKTGFCYLGYPYAVQAVDLSSACFSTSILEKYQNGLPLREVAFP